MESPSTYETVDDLNLALIEACKSSDHELVRRLIAMGAHNFNEALKTACKFGENIGAIVNLTIKKGACTNEGFIGACEGGILDNVKLMLARGATRLDLGLRSACFGGHRHIVNFLIADENVTAWEDGFYGACRGGHRAIIDEMLDKFSVWQKQNKAILNNGLRSAACGGHLDVADFVIEKGATNFNRGLEYACSGGNVEMAKYMIEKGATNFDKAFYVAFHDNNMHVFRFLLDYAQLKVPSVIYLLKSCRVPSRKALQLLKFTMSTFDKESRCELFKYFAQNVNLKIKKFYSDRRIFKPPPQSTAIVNRAKLFNVLKNFCCKDVNLFNTRFSEILFFRVYYYYF